MKTKGTTQANWVALFMVYEQRGGGLGIKNQVLANGSNHWGPPSKPLVFRARPTRPFLNGKP